MTDLPSWLLYLVGMLPVPEWAKALIEGVVEIILMLPWFKKPAAILALRDVCSAAKVLQHNAAVMSVLSDTPDPHVVKLFTDFQTKWKPLIKK